MPLFKRFVEIGRVCVINLGENEGKLCVILDLLDQNRVMVDGPSDITGVHRQVIKLDYLSLTDIKIKLGRGARLRSLKNAFVKGEVQKKWEKTSWAKKLAGRNKKASLNDFERFNVMLAKKKRASIVGLELRKLKKAYNKENHNKKK